MASQVTSAQAEAAAKVLTGLQTDSAALSSHVATQLRSLVSGDDAASSSSSSGISLLALKNSTLLSYTQNLLLLSSHTLRGLSLDPSAPGVQDVEAAKRGQALVRNLVKLRMRLEKMRPVEARAKNQIDRLLRAANERRMGKSSVAKAREGEDDDGEADVGLLSFRPNPSAMLSGSAPSRRGAAVDDELDDEGTSRRMGSRNNSTSDGIYRPPRLAPVTYDPDARSSKSRDGERSRSAARNASLLADLASSISSAPHEQSSGGVGVDAMGSAASSSRAKALARMQAYEEDNFTRLNLSKKDEKKRRRDEADVALGGAGLTGRGMVGRIGGGLEEELGEILRNAEGRGGKKRKGAGQGARNEAYEELRGRAKREGALQRSRDGEGGRGKMGKSGGTFEIAANGGTAGKSAFGKAVKGYNKRQRAKGGA